MDSFAALDSITVREDGAEAKAFHASCHSSVLEAAAKLSVTCYASSDSKKSGTSEFWILLPSTSKPSRMQSTFLDKLSTLNRVLGKSYAALVRHMLQKLKSKINETVSRLFSTTACSSSGTCSTDGSSTWPFFVDSHLMTESVRKGWGQSSSQQHPQHLLLWRALINESIKDEGESFL